MPVPTTQFSYRSAKELTVWSGYPEYQPIKGFEKPETTTKTFKYSKYGHVYAYATNEGVKVYDAESLVQRCDIKRANVVDLWLSPQGNYMATWERPTKLEDGSGSRNLMIWDTNTGAEIASFSQKSQNSWNFQWTDDEKYCARMVTGEVQFWESKNAGKAVWARLKLDGVAEFSLSPGKAPAVAVFIPERKGAPAIVRMYSIPSFNQPVSNKTFYKADRVQMFWNDLGTSLLVLTQTDIDKTGKSYYGETNLYYLAVAGNFDCRVPLDKEGPVHDVTWGPDSKEFVVVYGSMPAKATLFDHRANPVHSFGINPRNFVRYNPQGRTICIAGFGNLNGTIDLYDRKTLNKVNSFSATNASHCEWSPCGRYLMTATLTPRLRVDNGFKMWHHTGTLIYEEAVDELFQVGWRPEPASKYPMRSVSPAPAPIKVLPASGPAAKPVAAPAGAYRPPHLRGSAAPTTLSQREAMLTTGRSPAGSNRRIPGAKPVASKNGGKSAAAPAPAPSAASASAITPEEKQKKIRNLEKKLRQIKELREKQARGEKLEAPQLQKLSSEASVMRELAALHNN
ncbi:eukaryotic translation initiation factor eIF2A-domain-containing protein [Radiomyces spectabilis]|uniref:eukaryotic translation initiation factor eIF2A-domain-containing protein n=1 Tax=Radiomyces spectabilis TaxID=64574 RepID=UPI00221E7E38|nr:eukaryotic translation initiation factor eIF2A-domain-containing protein [Radiomyces spectabilis]KAI8374302.1 eukaryotic translation initiation factor eIF2A-domain-containing protein [Radiomyces spectabilis]